MQKVTALEHIKIVKVACGDTFTTAISEGNVFCCCEKIEPLLKLISQNAVLGFYDIHLYQVFLFFPNLLNSGTFAGEEIWIIVCNAMIFMTVTII